MPLHLNGMTVGDCINATTKAANRAKHPDGYEVNLDRTTILRYLNLYLYICAANADIASTPAQTYRPRSAAVPIRDRFREVQSYDTGLAPVIGAAVMFARIPGADIGTTFGLAVSPSQKAAKLYCDGYIRCWSVAVTNPTQPRFTQSNNPPLPFSQKWL